MDPKLLVDGFLGVVTFPRSASRVLELLDDFDSSLGDVSEALGLDPGLAARVLRVANSPIYFGGASVDSLPRAVQLLGRSLLREVVFGAAAIKTFDDLDVDRDVLHYFWQHSILTGAIAAEIAQQSRAPFKETAFTAGLLHDLGQLVLFVQARHLFRAVLETVSDDTDESILTEAEYRVLGFSHCEIGHELAKAWAFPRSLCEALAYHHRPELAIEHRGLVATIHLAESAAVFVEVDASEEQGLLGVDPEAWEIARLKPEAVPAVIAAGKARFADARSALLG